MKRWVLFAVVVVGGMRSGVAQSGETSPQSKKGQMLLDQMVTALGGQAWVEMKQWEEDGRIAAFFRNEPNGSNVQFFDYKREPLSERIEFATPKNLMPGSVRDVVQVWTPVMGYEVTYKGRKELPEKQVTEYNRRRMHSIRQVVTVWMKRPGVIVVSEGTSVVERRIADKFTVLSPDDDAVTIETDANTHLPLRRTFQWRNPLFKDLDEEIEEYEDYHTYDGFPTALSVTEYHNGDMVLQRFLTKAVYGHALPDEMFDPDHLLQKKK
ncbi:hypothetical protein [Granulicella sibirica]|uniref:Outer membrane lipoprotein-sorting protein n=1 Tax=Granulicella sibirica TaxID=2479048 RepID=A0A4Q0T5B1_9BACT|nr:hypothetical protein [Granulicella sibirica]RXH58903.1 hypothetical protein GRAN_2213 [Granulicella sibirica]